VKWFFDDVMEHNDILCILEGHQRSLWHFYYLWSGFLYLDCRKLHTLCKDVAQVPRRYPKCLVIPNRPISFKISFSQLTFVFYHLFLTTQHPPPAIRPLLHIKIELLHPLHKYLTVHPLLTLHILCFRCASAER
jgi:hypothetical protein